MALVDYSSSSSDSDSSPPPPPKQHKPTPAQPSSISSSSSPSALPPLPPSFHDLYASTVRQSPLDDPSLHQGRRRQTPHVVGNWPSHLYIEWRPSSAQHSLLASFLSKLQSALSESKVELTGFLTSDLSAPLPLHVSLSRPFVLPTNEKDEFLSRVTAAVRQSRVGRFSLDCGGGVEWHRTPESNRSFLVLRVRSSSSAVGGEHCGVSGSDEEGKQARPNRNPELTALLEKCNATVAAYGQPQLYRWADDEARMGDAFHVSIAWSFAEPDEEVRSKTWQVFAEEGLGDTIRQMQFEVDGVKAKIGNIVNQIALVREAGKRPKGLLGI